MFQQKNNEKPFLLVQQIQNIESIQLRNYFEKWPNWMLSSYFKDQQQYQFQQALIKFFDEIQQIKNKKLSNNLNFFKMISIQGKINRLDFQLEMEKFKIAAFELEILLKIVEIEQNIQIPSITIFGLENFQKVTIIIEKQSVFPFNKSFIFGIQCQIPFNQSFFQPSKPFNENMVKSQMRFLQSQRPSFVPSVPEDASIFTTSQIAAQPITNQIISKKLQTPVSNKQIIQTTCQICCESYVENAENQIILPCCNRIVHKQCTQQALIKTQDFFQNQKCFFCNKPYDMNFLRGNISQKIFQEKARELVLLKYFEACFSCKAKIQVLPEQKKTICKLNCSKCQATICSRCLKAFHGEQFICQEIRLEIIQLLQGQPIIICPFCDLIQTKDDGCNHVTCNQCKMDLCSVCSVDRRPILSHGNHFHRKGCIDYRELKEKQNMIKEKRRDCKLCKESPDGACYLPIDLETYKKEKGY